MFLEIINIKSNDITRENANMNADTPAGMMMKFSSETTKPFVDDYLLSEEVKRRNQESGRAERTGLFTSISEETG